MSIEKLTFDRLSKENFRALLIHMHDMEASDAFIQSDELVTFKVHGNIVPATEYITEEHDVEELIAGTIASNSFLNAISRGRPQSLSYGIKKAKLKDGSISNLRFRLEISSVYSNDGISIVIRDIPVIPPHVDDLGLDKRIVDVQLEFRHGIGFVCGATSSGKSTSIAAMIRLMLETMPKHIYEVSSPMEFMFDKVLKVGIITPKEVPTDVESFPLAIRSSLRSSPDSVSVAEVRDMETSDALLQISETGHNVITTLHVSRAHLLFQRLSSFYPADQRDRIISKTIDQLNFVLIQMLVPKIGGGRVAVREYIIVDADMKRKLHSIPQSSITIEFEKLVKTHGVTMYDHARELMKTRTITEQTFKTVCYGIGESAHARL